MLILNIRMNLKKAVENKEELIEQHTIYFRYLRKMK